MDIDPTFNIGPEFTGLGAIAEWKKVLQRDDITEEQRLFATWSLAGLYCTKLDHKKGGKPDFAKSKDTFKQVLQMRPGFYSEEIFNAASMYGTHPGSPSERADLLSESYLLLMGATTDQLKNSAVKINRLGYSIDKKFFSQIARLPDLPVDEKTKLLEKRCKEVRGTMENSIEDFLKYTTDIVAASTLIDRLEQVAPEEKVKNWINFVNRIAAQKSSEVYIDLKSHETLISRQSNQLESNQNSTATTQRQVASHIPTHDQELQGSKWSLWMTIGGSILIIASIILIPLALKRARLRKKSD
jgi:hypothetical protein